jgi:heterodisulfide reductase subunit A-like polyferredoxin
MSFNVSESFDVLVFGVGIAGMQSALDLADQDYRWQ